MLMNRSFKKTIFRDSHENSRALDFCENIQSGRVFHTDFNVIKIVENLNLVVMQTPKGLEQVVLQAIFLGNQ